MLPIIRTFISLPAGVARMPFWRFTLFTVAGCIPWVLMLGDRRPRGRRQLGEVDATTSHYLDYVVVLARSSACVVYLILRRRSGGSGEDQGARRTDGAAEPAGAGRA